MREPESMSPGSIMPAYPWLLENDLDMSLISAKVKTMQTLGVPYSDEAITSAMQDATQQAEEIAATLKKEGITVAPNKEIVALIAYLQRLGTDIKATDKTAQK
jgi:cytochrome c oxidase cbb3-type subunit I/II